MELAKPEANTQVVDAVVVTDSKSDQPLLSLARPVFQFLLLS